MKLNNIFLIISILFLAAGCSYYSLKGSIPSHLDKVIVTPVVNETTEFELGKKMHDSLIELIIDENILTLTSYENADCKIDITIIKITDNPDVILNNSNGYESVNQWKISIQTDLLWYDMFKNENILEKNIIESVVYSYDSDIGLDGIDNDQDGLIDSEDPDEVLIGTPRDSAVELCMNKITKRIINELTSTW